ncbi:hypothetical protein JXA05_01160 [Candidatus Peregrinibacteria bacterium]|nr:hypothetical protein [Candidatus Peregrinibacteria bacterium]
MKTCIACGMPLDDPQTIGGEMADGAVCVHCWSPAGGVKSCEEVFEGGVQYFMGAMPGTDRLLAEKLTRKNMKSLPYWQQHGGDCLTGEEASDQEFADAMSKL